MSPQRYSIYTFSPPGGAQVKSGMVTLAIGSLVGVGITVLLSHWFKPTKHGKGGEEDADSEAHEV